MPPTAQTRRIQITLPIGIYSKLEMYANQTGANLATTASYLVQNKLEELEEKGLLEIKADKALEQLLEAMLNGLEEKDVDFEKIAKVLKRDAQDLKRIYKKIKSCEECKK